EITGTDSVNGVSYIERETGEEKHIEIAGIFIQIRLVPNTAWLGDAVERNKFGEILTDKRGATNVTSVFEPGDSSDSPFKQIIISMGSGATASLAAVDYLVRN